VNTRIDTAIDTEIRSRRTGLAIEVERVRQIYTVGAGYVHALEGVSFEMCDGEFVSVVGPSGCGKSTLLRIILGLLRPTSGEVRIQGRKVTGLQRGVGIVFQSPVLMAWRRVLDNVLLPVEILGLDYKIHQQKAMELLDLVGLQGFEQSYPDELSGGMQQRAAICRALIHDPDVLLMDEPFGALDAITREQMNFELLRIWKEKGKTILFITHSIHEALFLSDRVVVMTARPGGVSAFVEVPLPRPRTLEMLAEPGVVCLASKIREWMGTQMG
jgi:NitT/TauT family transport system ATP-binding protein